MSSQFDTMIGHEDQISHHYILSFLLQAEVNQQKLLIVENVWAIFEQYYFVIHKAEVSKITSLKITQQCLGQYTNACLARKWPENENSFKLRFYLKLLVFNLS